MLDEVIKVLQNIKLHAEGLGSEINNQKRMIQLLNNKAEKARINLQKRSSALQETLQKYRSTNKFCVDVILLVVFLVLVGVLLSILKKKNII